MKKVATLLLPLLLATVISMASATQAQPPSPQLTAVTQVASNEADTKSELKLMQQQLEFYKERLEDQDKRIGDIGFYLTISGALIAIVVLVFGWRAMREAKAEAREEANQQVKSWLNNEGRVELLKKIDDVLKPEVKKSLNEIQAVAEGILSGLESERQKAHEWNENLPQHINQLVSSVLDKKEALAPEEQRQVEIAVHNLESKPPKEYRYEDWILLGIEAYEKGRFEIAADHFGRAEGVADSAAGKAKALLNKGATLGQLERSEEAIAVYDEVLRRYGETTEAALRESVARALVNKGFRLGQLQRSEEAIAVNDEVVRRYGEAPEAALRELVGKALVNKGFTLGQLQHNEEAIAVNDEVVWRYGELPDAAFRELVAKALVNKGSRLGQLHRYEEAIAVNDEVVQRYGEAPEVVLRELVASALNSSGFAMLCQAKKIWCAGSESDAKQLLERALVKIDAALQRQPDDPMILGNHGYILFLLGRVDEAKPVLTRAIELGGEELRKVELADAEIHPLSQDEAFKALVNSL